MEDITDADYKHGKKVKKKFEIKTLGELHDLYVQSNTVLLADVFENFRNKFIKNTNLNQLIFISTWISMTSMIEKTDVKLELLTNIDVLLMVQKRIRGGVFNSIHQYAATKNKYMKKYNTDNESSYIMCLDPNNIYGWAMSQKLPVDGFEGQKKNYDESSDIGYILKADVEYPERLHLQNDLPFLPERINIKKCNKLGCNLYDNNNYVAHIRTLKQALISD